MDTIYAVASGGSVSGVCIVRVSGPSAYEIAQRLTNGRALMARKPVVRRLVDKAGDLIDIALVIYFEHGKSFTGQATVEFHVHGSLAIRAKLLNEISKFSGTRPAGPGDFTRLALQNGTLDLTQVEGLGQLLNAETESQRKQALRLFDGGVGKLVDSWRARLIQAGATIEASIDFSDEDIELDWDKMFFAPLNEVLTEIDAELIGQAARQKISTGFEVAIVGQTNVGKSTLLNALAGRDVALTSNVAGTTRDVIEVRMNLGGYLVTFLDTAGVRVTESEIEQMGIDAGRKRADSADIRVFLVNAPGEHLPFTRRDGDIVLTAKSDLGHIGEDGVSGLTGHGVAALIERIRTHLSQLPQDGGITVGERQASALMSAAAGLRAIVDQPIGNSELVASDVTAVLQSMDFLVGRVDVEDYLDHVFSSFCIGK